MKESASFETVDLILASFLRARGFEIAGVRSHDSRATFSFAQSDMLQHAVLDYINDGPVGVRTFSNTLRDLKALVRSMGAADSQALSATSGE